MSDNLALCEIRLFEFLSAESAADVTERATRRFWTAFALSLLASGERGTESV